jgi:hypothetical protein
MYNATKLPSLPFTMTLHDSGVGTRWYLITIIICETLGVASQFFLYNITLFCQWYNQVISYSLKWCEVTRISDVS